MPDWGIGEVGNADSLRYANYLTVMHDTNMSWEGLSYSFYNSEGGNVDIYIPVLTFIVSRFTGNPHILFMIFAFVFGFFYSRNIWCIINHIKTKYDTITVILILSFALATPIWQINGVRMWTALHIFLYGILPYLFSNNNIRKLPWCFASVLVHFSFIIPCAIVIIFHFIPKKTLPLFMIFIFSCFIQELDIAIIREKLFSLGFSAFENRIDIYTSETAVSGMQHVNEKLSAHVILAKALSKYLHYILIVICYFSIYKRKDVLTNHLFCFTTLFYSFANIAACVPSGGRFVILAQMITDILTIICHISNTNIKRSFMICSIALIYPIIFSIRTGMDFWGLNLLITNPITCWFISDNIPIISFIK